MASKRVLIVDDEENIGRSLRMILEREGYAVNVCKSVAEFRRHPDAQRADAYLLDMKLPDGNGIDLLKLVRQNGATSPAIMISGHGTIADAVEATRAGAFDFLEKPLGRDRVLLAIKNAMEHSTLRQENERLREMVGGAPKMIGSSPAWLRAVEQATMAARSDARVLLSASRAPGRNCWPPTSTTTAPSPPGRSSR
jgi:two-component system, NtrC family, nitrogen regulation response regulator NtrX